MKWTKKKPEEEGWYWYREDKKSDPYVIEICSYQHETEYSVWETGIDNCNYLSTYNGYFSPEPIHKPKGYEDE